ncbi:MAG TPA: CocE/NonD family hydrolase, partial [Actinomycetota bacterium]|nr:CocE/NonD family hydrolase [Actinomycetota bacterium]
MRRLLTLAMLLVLALPATAAAEPPEGSVWTEDYIESADRSDGGPTLHADIFRPEGMAEDVKTPVIMVVSPYTNHSGGPLDPDPNERPSSRFNDFVEEARLMERGYTYVIVDLRGTGGSEGCNDWGGPGEQADTKEAVEWAARQEWSNGRVGLYGKSYDGWTGLMALAQRPEGLAAVVSQEPVVDGYRYLYMNRVPFPNRTGTPAQFQVIDAQPGHPLDDPQYHISSMPKDPSCYESNVSDQQNPDPNSEFWRSRNLIDAVTGSTTPTFMMAGFLENNTKPDHVWTLWNNLSGSENRGWFGQWDHIRGTDRGIQSGDEEFFEKHLAGRAGFTEEAARFFDRHVKGLPPAEAPTHLDPKIVVQSNDGGYRYEQAWPPADVLRLRSSLLGGSYVDDGGNDGTGSGGGNGLWTFSTPLERTVHLAGPPTVELDLTTSGADANLVADVYDVSPDRKATLVSRGAYLIPDSGRHGFELYPQDWRFKAGHRIGILLTDANDEWWAHGPSDATVEIASARIDLPFLPAPRVNDLDGKRSLKLRNYLEEAPFEVSLATIVQRASPFAVPPG